MKKAKVAETFRVIADGIEFEFEPAEEGGYTVTVPALPGCISEGDTFEEALANIRDALEGCLMVARKHGLPIPQQLQGKVA